MLTHTEGVSRGHEKGCLDVVVLHGGAGPALAGEVALACPAVALSRLLSDLILVGLLVVVTHCLYGRRVKLGSANSNST